MSIVFFGGEKKVQALKGLAFTSATDMLGNNELNNLGVEAVAANSCVEAVAAIASSNVQCFTGESGVEAVWAITDSNEHTNCGASGIFSKPVTLAAKVG